MQGGVGGGWKETLVGCLAGWLVSWLLGLPSDLLTIKRMIASMCCTGLRHFLHVRCCPISVRMCMNRTLLYGSL